MLTLAVISVIAVNAVAADSDSVVLPNIAAYDDVAYYPLAELVPAEFDGLTTPVEGLVASTEITEPAVAEYNGGLPEVAVVDEVAIDSLPDLVPAE